HQNCPNPFNSGTEIRFALPEAGHVRLTIYNVLGKEIRTLVDEDKKVGRYNVHWDGTDSKGNSVSSGIYIYRLEAGSFTDQKRMLFVK
ncbi:MAG: FlgD immunoglobulin-like domain containing protein, partial [bacterium]